MSFEKKKLRENFNILSMFRGIPPNIQENKAKLRDYTKYFMDSD